MIDLLQITNDPALAARCDSLAGMRIFLDLERNGKAERQAGRNTFISQHQIADIAPVKAALRMIDLMVRVNPLSAATAAEVDAVLAEGADMLMLPMFRSAKEVAEFSRIVDGRCPIVLLLETRGALECVPQWLDTPGIWEVFVGLNDLHASLGCRFMFEPLAQGHVDRVAHAVHAKGLRFGFGGIARMGEGELPGRQVLAEHVRLGSQAVILSRTFHRADPTMNFEAEVATLRGAEYALSQRSPEAVLDQQLATMQLIDHLAARGYVRESSFLAPL